MTTVLILGSGPNAVASQGWPEQPFDHRLVINNAWRVRPDWTHLIYAEDFPEEKRPETTTSRQSHVEADRFVPAQNAYGGFVWAGGTMAFTAGYWALHALKPKVLAYLGCDMVYAPSGDTHFYGSGTQDPLRKDVTLRSLEAKSARLQAHAALQGCAIVNLSGDQSRLVFPRAELSSLEDQKPVSFDKDAIASAQSEERALGYFVASGRYWEEENKFDPVEIDRIDAVWRQLHAATENGS